MKKLSNALQRARGRLIGVNYSYWKARVLQIALERRLFETIENWKSVEPVTARGVAVRAGWEPRAAELFLNALAGCGFLVKAGSQYRNTPEGKEFFIPGKKYYLGHLVGLGAQGLQAWERLEDSLRSGAAPQKPEFFSQDRSRVKHFTLAMRDSAIGHSDLLARRLSLKGRRRLVDLGAGPGIFSIAFLKANPELRATLFDLAPVLETAREQVEAEGLGARADYQAGNFLTDALPDSCDTAFLSHILHGLSEDDCRRLLEKIFKGLAPGGLLIIQDFFLEKDLARPEFAALFSLNMLLHANGGRSYSAEEVTEWLKKAGFKTVSRPRLGLPRDLGVLTAAKK